jgi:predicted transcriptional regulator
MKPKEIRAALILAEVTSLQIARQLGVSGAAVSRVIYGNTRSARIETVIAKSIGSTRTKVFVNRQEQAA